jgi:hypothetical protein
MLTVLLNKRDTAVSTSFGLRHTSCPHCPSMMSRLGGLSQGNRTPRAMGRRAACAALASSLVGCQYPPGSSEQTQWNPSRARLAKPPVVILVAMDGVRWEDIYYGPTSKGSSVASSRSELIPHLLEMERSGVSWGAPRASEFHASGPNFVSLPGYMEMLAGSVTRCTENDCRKMDRATLLDDFQALSPEDPSRAAAFSRGVGLGFSMKCCARILAQEKRWPRGKVRAAAKESFVTTGSQPDLLALFFMKRVRIFCSSVLVSRMSAHTKATT